MAAVSGRGPRHGRAWVDEAVRLAPLVDVREAARRLTRRRDLVDACVERTLREPAWLREAP